MILKILLSAILFVPLLGGVFVLFLWNRPLVGRIVALGTALTDLFLILTLMMLIFLSGSMAGAMIFVDIAWIPQFGIGYRLAMDGISLCLIFLAAFLSVLSILVSWQEIRERMALFHFFILAMQTGVTGVFLAADLFLFYLFWELQLIPMFFLIGIWGHENRVYAALKFVVFGIFGSLLMLLAIIGLYLHHGSATGVYSFSLFTLLNTPMSMTVQLWLYAAFLLSFAIRIPVFPLHTWLPDAHTEAPTAGSVLLAGLLLKTGAYALLRFGFPLFPDASGFLSPVLIVLGLFGLFYASWIALAQKDIKRLVAYSSIGHMGLIVVGIGIFNALTLSGVVVQMINHGITTSALFIMAGMLQQRAGTRQIADFGGLWKKMPVYSAFFLLFAMASVGLPGLNNFVGEILILVGAFKHNPWVGFLGFAGIVFILVYMLKLVQDLLFGEPSKEFDMADITPREAAILIPLAMIVFYIGLYPAWVLGILEIPVQNIMDQAINTVIPEMITQ